MPRTKRVESSADKARWHTWTSYNRKYTMRAKFRDYDPELDIVLLEREEDGLTVQFFRKHLSEGDWNWIKSNGWHKSPR